MNKTLLLTIFLGVATLAGVLYTTQNQSGSFLQPKYIKEFVQFQAQFQRQYSIDEIPMRHQAFSNNMDIIKTQNALYDAGNSTFFLGVNKLADLTTAEYKQSYLGYKKVSKRQNNLAEFVNAAVPASIDWTTKGAVNAVKDQGQCGSCWAFSSASSLESLNFIKGHKLTSFSEQAIMDCSTSYGNEGCNGGDMDAAFEYTAKSGVATEASYPYTEADGTCRKFTSVFKNTGHTDVTVNSQSALLAAIAKQPVSVAIEADQSCFQLYSGGILNDSSCGTNTDHGVVAVGYGSNFYKIRNSWGSSWGENGYIRLARTGNGAGQCGVQSDPSYPTA